MSYLECLKAASYFFLDLNTIAYGEWSQWFVDKQSNCPFNYKRVCVKVHSTHLDCIGDGHKVEDSSGKCKQHFI